MPIDLFPKRLPPWWERYKNEEKAQIPSKLDEVRECLLMAGFGALLYIGCCVAVAFDGENPGITTIGFLACLSMLLGLMCLLFKPLD